MATQHLGYEEPGRHSPILASFPALLELRTYRDSAPTALATPNSHLWLCTSLEVMLQSSGTMNCPAPAGSSGWEIVKQIRRVAQAYGGIKVFKAYLELPLQSCSPESRSLQLRSELQASGVSLTDCPHNGRKDVADKMMLVDMMAHAIDNPAPSTYVLISGDRDFAYALAVLRLRCYQVVLVTHSAAHNSLKSQATTLVDWNKILGRVAPSYRNRQAQEQRPPSATPDQDAPTEETHSLGNPFKDNVPCSSEPCRIDGAVDLTSYGQRKSHSSISSGDSEFNSAIHDATTRKHVYPVQDGSPLPPSLPSVPQTNKKYDTGPRPVPPSASVNHHDWTSTTGYAGPSRADVPKYGFGNPQPAASGLLTQEAGRFPELVPTFVAPSLASSSLSPQISPTWNLTNFTPSSTLNQPPYLPPIFHPLVKVLQAFHMKGNLRPLRSIIAFELNKQPSFDYKQANVDKFDQYVALAEEARVVVLGGREASGWISLRPEWCR